VGQRRGEGVVIAVLHLLGNDIDANLIVVECSHRQEHGATAQNGNKLFEHENSSLCIG
jgi:hypothetical protein